MVLSHRDSLSDVGGQAPAGVTALVGAAWFPLAIDLRDPTGEEKLRELPAQASFRDSAWWR
jgi:hypothetical protein